ncbi:sugar phosphate isomerase/epimerase family protein [Flavobacterium sp. 3HN19-14]|uniref:sugar phosphate isomerase/epimerase family protein n=1 Tax=Flavobacterium sp. 3HN19-14 TaxID=3448133 RepID=UPI003EE1CE20
MNRRDFIKNTAQFGLALSITGLPVISDLIKLPAQPFFKLSLAQWSLHRAISETKTLSALDFAAKAKELGFEGIEYVSQLYELDKESLYQSMKKLVKELQLRSADNNIQNVLIMVDGEGELAASSKKTRKAAIANHHKWVDAAHSLGCHSIRVNLFGDGNENNYEKSADPAMDGLLRLSEYAKKSNIGVIVENHGGLSSDIEKLTKVINGVNMKNCGTLPDFGNFCVRREGGDRWTTPCVATYDRYKGVSEMMPFAKGVSAKSYDFDANGNETTIDYLKMLKIVKDANYKGFIGVEYEGNRLSEIDGILSTKALLLKLSEKV